MLLIPLLLLLSHPSDDLELPLLDLHVLIPGVEGMKDKERGTLKYLDNRGKYG